ncbi:MAG TPA: FGGY family carbohydrate kinase [Chryseosolibacter sp.]|nr:FGGY family carbohydrate kinase [Chryseosolibacter sp.]
MPVPAVAIFDIGKTNKKLFLFDQSYKIVFERSVHLAETVDEDDGPCEDITSLQDFVSEGLRDALENKDFKIRAVNASAYGASFVYIDQDGKPVGCLTNYLKPYPDRLRKQFYDTYGGEKLFSFQTASPVLGSLNSGMQLYRVKYEKPEVFDRIKYALHLPQYISYLVSGRAFAEITSIGCHTNLWNFQSMEYHHWVKREGLLEKFPDIAPSDMVVQPLSFRYRVGIGLHDSSAALIPYLVSFTDPFLLISTGTWAISLNPFNASPLTKLELECDCLCYLQYKGTPVKASRLFAGHFHDEQVSRIAAHFNQSREKYFKVPFDAATLDTLDTSLDPAADPKVSLQTLRFADRDLSSFGNDVEAYHQLMFDLVVQQYTSTKLIMKGSPVKKIFVDGGFSNNAVFMNLLASFFPDMEVYASSVPQATAIGAALAIHDAWNAEHVPTNIVQLKQYKSQVVISGV